jgi:glycosyltransferase domain-containing protein
LLVPTMNRSEFVIRMLAYYAQVGFTGRIAIGDSSNADHVQRTRDAIRSVEGSLDVAYAEYPRAGLGACLAKLLDHVSTPYAATLPDDDFLIPSSLEQCARFLSEHPDYAAAHGVGVSVSLDTNGLHGHVTQCTYYPQPVIEAETAAERLDDHLGHYTVSMFSVHRLDTWRRMLQNVHLQEDASFSAELLPCCHSVVAGKVKELDCLYVVRQNHNLRYELPDAFDWLTGPKWRSSYQIFLEDVSQALAERDGVTLEEAGSVVKRAFKQYLVLCLGVRRRWTGAAWTLAAARRAKRLLKTLTPKEHSQFELPALLDPASRYHADFIPVYQVLITSPPDGADHTATVSQETRA